MYDTQHVTNDKFKFPSFISLIRSHFRAIKGSYNYYCILNLKNNTIPIDIYISQFDNGGINASTVTFGWLSSSVPRIHTVFLRGLWSVFRLRVHSVHRCSMEITSRTF